MCQTPTYVFGFATDVFLFLIKEIPHGERKADQRASPGARSLGQIPALMLVSLMLQSLVLGSVSFSVPASASVKWGPCNLPHVGCEDSVGQDVQTLSTGHRTPAQVWTLPSPGTQVHTFTGIVCLAVSPKTCGAGVPHSGDCRSKDPSGPGGFFACLLAPCCPGSVSLTAFPSPPLH